MKPYRQLLSRWNTSFSRRDFFKFGTIVSAFPLLGNGNSVYGQSEAEKIRKVRKLGRTNFMTSVIAMGGTRSQDSNVYRYAYDKGVNYFDVAEGYFNGGAERMLGKVIKHMDRKKIFITTKLGFGPDETEESIIKRFKACQRRLQTGYIDCLYMHGISDIRMLRHKAFHSATKKLRSQGKLRFIGLSSHGPEEANEDSMEKVMLAAADDGRFDVVLFVYNFMNSEAGRKIIAACKKNNVGVTAMKTSPGVFEYHPLDPNHLTRQQEEDVQELMREDSLSREKALQEIASWQEEDKENFERTKPFIQQYGIKSKLQLQLSSVRWVLKNEDVHTVCVSFADYDLVDQMIPVSDLKFGKADSEFIEQYRHAYNNVYCRHACSECLSSCPYSVPVNRIMRYNYYFHWHGNEKSAMQKYARMNAQNASVCENCPAPCNGQCPHNIDIRKQMIAAHNNLQLA